MMDVIGVDIGATKVNVLRVGDAGVIDRRWQAHDAASGDDAFTCARRLIAGAIAEARVAAIGVSVAGLVDSREGVLVDGGLLLVKNMPLRRELEAAFVVPVVVENDANATLIAALAEHEPSGREATSLLFALGTGIGGAVAIGRDVLHGSFGYGGELGHLPVGPVGGVACVCGSTGCLELVASGSGIARLARDAAAAGQADRLLELAAKPWDQLTSIDVLQAARARDRFSRKLLTEAGDAVGRAITALGAAIDPETVFISGSLGHAAADILIPTIERRIEMQHAYPRARPLPVVRTDSHGPDAAAIGAALLARQMVETTSWHRPRAVRSPSSR